MNSLTSIHILQLIMKKNIRIVMKLEGALEDIEIVDGIVFVK